VKDIKQRLIENSREGRISKQRLSVLLEGSEEIMVDSIKQLLKGVSDEEEVKVDEVLPLLQKQEAVLTEIEELKEIQKEEIQIKVKEIQAGDQKEIQREKGSYVPPRLISPSSSKRSLKSEKSTPRDINPEIKTTPRSEWQKGSVHSGMKGEKSKDTIKSDKTDKSKKSDKEMIEYDNTPLKDCVKAFLVGVVIFLAGLMFVTTSSGSE